MGAYDLDFWLGEVAPDGREDDVAQRRHEDVVLGGFGLDGDLVEGAGEELGVPQGVRSGHGRPEEGFREAADATVLLGVVGARPVVV